MATPKRSTKKRPATKKRIDPKVVSVPELIQVWKHVVREYEGLERELAEYRSWRDDAAFADPEERAALDRMIGYSAKQLEWLVKRITPLGKASPAKTRTLIADYHRVRDGWLTHFARLAQQHVQPLIAAKYLHEATHGNDSFLRAAAHVDGFVAQTGGETCLSRQSSESRIADLAALINDPDVKCATTEEPALRHPRPTINGSVWALHHSVRSGTAVLLWKAGAKMDPREIYSHLEPIRPGARRAR